MKMVIKHIFTSFLVFILIFSFIAPDIAYAVDIDDVSLRVEKDIMDAYKIKAEEQNVKYMRDRDSVLADITETVLLESSTKSAAEVGRDIDAGTFAYDMEIYKDEFYRQWAMLSMGYADATGWVNGTKDEMAAASENNPDKVGYNYRLADTGCQNKFANPSTWTNNETAVITQEIKTLANKIYTKYNLAYLSSADATITVTYDSTLDKYNPSDNTDRTHWGFYCDVNVGNGRYDPPSMIIYVPTANGGGYYDAANSVLNSIKGITDFQVAYVESHLKNKRNSGTAISAIGLEYLMKFPTMFDFSNVTVTSNGNIVNNTATYNINNVKLKDSAYIDLKYKDIINSANYYDVAKRDLFYIAYFEMIVLQHNDENAEGSSLIVAPLDENAILFAPTDNPVYQGRKKCLQIINATYDGLYAASFEALVKTVSEETKNYLASKAYFNYEQYFNGTQAAYGVGKARPDLVYEGFVYSTDTNNDYYYCGTTGYYYQGLCFKYMLDGTIDINSNEKYDKYLDQLMVIDNPAIYKTPENGSFHKYYDQTNTAYVNEFVREIEKYAETVDADEKAKWVEPQKIEVLFDDTTVSYASYLTTSCIIDNPLNRYEFWAQNASNENDKTYFKEAVLVETNKNVEDASDAAPDDTSNFVRNPEEAQNIQIDGKDHWGTYLFTRYKYMDYVFRIYYGFVENTPSRMISKDIVMGKADKDREIYRYSGAKKVYPRKATNKYGWFWKSTYYEKELSGGYYVTPEIVAEELEVINTHIKQNIDDDNEIVWVLGQEKWDLANKADTPAGKNSILNCNKESYKGDIYRYKYAVRAATTYYQVRIPISSEEDGLYAGKFDVKIGGDVTNYQCDDSSTICDCSEDNSCTYDVEDLVFSSTLTQ